MKANDTLIAYYLQKFTVSDEITTLTRDYGNAPANNSSGAWPEAWTATGFAVVRPGNVINRTDEQIYEKLMLRGWMSNVDYDGFGAGKQSVGVIYAENNSDFEVEKITIVKGTNATNQWPAATGHNNTVTWARETNEAGDKWFVEDLVWSADDPDKYGTTPILNGLKNEKYCFDENNKCFLILIYLRTVEKETNLNLRYVDRTDDTVIYSSQISMKYTQGGPVPTYADSLKDGNTVIGDKKDWPDKTAGAANYLPDTAYVTNSADQPQYFNKRISTFSGIDAKYKTGLYVYDGAVISDDGKTLTLYYDIDLSRLVATYVVDFGLPLEIPLKDLINNPDDVISVTVGSTVLSETPLTTDHGQLTYDAANKKITYTLTKAFDASMVSATFKLTLTKGNPVSITIGVIPASNVLYEENFLTKGTDTNVKHAEWTLDGQFAGKNQATHTSTDDALFGYDVAYEGITGRNGAWTVDGLSVDKSVSKPLTTEFYGNAFDLIGSCGADTAMAMIIIRNQDDPKAAPKAVLVDTRYNGDTLEQVPFGHIELGETDAHYSVLIRAYYAPAVSANSASSVSVMSVQSASDAAYAEELVFAQMEQDLAAEGLTLDDVEFISAADTFAAQTASVASYADVNEVTQPERAAGTHAAIDAFRVYRSTDNSNYIASEQNIKYWNIIDVMKGKVIKAYTENGNFNSNVENYEAAGGPQDEIYLDKGQAISFKIDDASSIQVSLRAVDGVTSWATSETGTATTIATNTEMYYVIKADNSGTFTIANRGDKLLAIGNVKLKNTVTSTDIQSADEIEEEVLLQSLRAAFGVSSVKPEPELFQPSTFDAKVSFIRLIRNKLVTVRVSVSSDVSYVTINGVKYWPGRLTRWQKTRYVQFLDTIGRYESKTYTIVAYDANGVASAPITVNG